MFWQTRFTETLIQTLSASGGRSRGGGLEEMIALIREAQFQYFCKKKLILFLIKVVLKNTDECFATASHTS